jgi:hypothetical protein
MALGYTTYKTPNAIFTINEDLSGKEGCGVYLSAQGTVSIADLSSQTPYGIVVVGGESNDGIYPGPIGGSAIEFVDMLGCTVQVLMSQNSNVTAGDFLLIDSTDGDGTFSSVISQAPQEGDWLWGYALTDAGPSEQCLMRFQPYLQQYVAP